MAVSFGEFTPLSQGSSQLFPWSGAVLIGLNMATQTEGNAKSLDFYRGRASLRELGPPNRGTLSVPSEKCTGGAQGTQAAHCREVTLVGLPTAPPCLFPPGVVCVHRGFVP